MPLPRRDPIQAVLDRAWEARPQQAPCKDSTKSPGLRRPRIGLSKTQPLGSELASFEKSCGSPKKGSRVGLSKTQPFGNELASFEKVKECWSPALDKSATLCRGTPIRRRGGSPKKSCVSPKKGSSSPKKSMRLRRHYSFSLGSSAADAFCDPKLRGSPQGVTRGSLRLSCGVSDLAAVEREGASSTAKLAFAELCSRLHMLVHQVCISMNEGIATIRERHTADTSYLVNSANYRSLARIVFEVSTSSYYFSKWCHELEPDSYSLSMKPSKAANSPADDLVSQLQSGVSRMQMHASSLCGMLQHLVRRPTSASRRGTTESISLSPWDVAQIKGLSVSELLGITAHLEHLLMDTQHLAGARSPEERDRPWSAPTGANSPCGNRQSDCRSDIYRRFCHAA